MTHALRVLEDLVRDLFDGDELRRFVTRWYGRSMMMELPGGGATGADTVHQFVQLLDRRGQIDDRLFGMIAAERPEAAGQVREVAQRLGHHVQEVPRRVSGEGLPDQVVDEIFGRLLAERDAVQGLFAVHEAIPHVVGAMTGSQRESVGFVKSRAAALREAYLRAYRPEVRQFLAERFSLASIAGSADVKVEGLGAIVAEATYRAVIAPLQQISNASEGALWQLANDIARNQVRQLGMR